MENKIPSLFEYAKMQYERSDAQKDLLQTIDAMLGLEVNRKQTIREVIKSIKQTFPIFANTTNYKKAELLDEYIKSTMDLFKQFATSKSHQAVDMHTALTEVRNAFYDGRLLFGVSEMPNEVPLLSVRIDAGPATDKECPPKLIALRVAPNLIETLKKGDVVDQWFCEVTFLRDHLLRLNFPESIYDPSKENTYTDALVFNEFMYLPPFMVRSSFTR